MALKPPPKIKRRIRVVVVYTINLENYKSLPEEQDEVKGIFLESGRFVKSSAISLAKWGSGKSSRLNKRNIKSNKSEVILTVQNAGSKSKRHMDFGRSRRKT
jgi:hypothetical protein